MVERNKLGKAFGPYAAFAGILLFIAGMFAFRSPVGILLLLAGIFLATATDETHIDVARRRIRPATVILGFIPLGTWQSAGDFKGLTLIPVYRRFSVYSLSNKQKISEERDFRIFILDKKNKQLFALKKCREKEEAREAMDRLSLSLQLPVFTIGGE